MRAVAIVVWLLVLLAMTWFAIKNAHPVTLHGFFDYQWNAPLVLVLLAFFAGGVTLGLLASMASVFRLKREISKMKAHQRKQEKLAAAVVQGGQSFANPTSAEPTVDSTIAPAAAATSALPPPKP
jgi:lipopolysaccharide assembly protein A